MVNGLTCLNLTKVDVFTGFDTIKIGASYIDTISGQPISGKMPASLKVLD